MTPKNAITWLEENPEVQSVLAAVVDLNGVLRGKRIPVEQVAKVLNDEMRLPLSSCCVDIWGEDIENSELVFTSGDADGICSVTVRGLLPVSWSDQRTAFLPLWLRNEDGTAFDGDPRHSLNSMVARFHSRGLTPVVATELEFYLFDTDRVTPFPPRSPLTGVRPESDGVLSVDELEHFEAFLNDVYAACRSQCIAADSAISENGAGQFEINLKHLADPLRAADDAIFLKKVVRGVARQHGMAASFMAKPYGERAGCGMHVHFSIVDKDGVNIFDNGTGTGSTELTCAVAGLLGSMHEMSLVFAPHANSYKRLAPGTHAPTAVTWGYENRTAAIRIPGGSSQSRRIEHRVAGADANPYLVLTAVLGGALAGIDQQMKPVAPITGDAYSMNLPQLCMDWHASIAAFENGSGDGQIFPEQLRKYFVQCKKQELQRFMRYVSDFEYQTYLHTV